MRIKLRLYLRDLDLLVLKQYKGFNFGSAIREALYEFVTFGECSRIQVPPSATEPIILKPDQVDISFTKEKYSDVVEWLMGIKPGMRNIAIKSVFRSAIRNPAVWAFACNSNTIIPEDVEKKLVQIAEVAKNEEPIAHTSVPDLPPVSILNEEIEHETKKQDGDLWSMSFDNL